MSTAIDSWESLKPDLLVERGVDPAIASAAGSLAVRRKHGSAERENLLGTIEELQTTVDTQAAEIEKLRGMLGVSSEEEKKDTRVTARRLLAELEIGPIVEEILVKGGNPKDLYESARIASDLKGFSERLEVDKSALVTSVRHMGYAGIDFEINAGRSTGKPVETFDEQSPIQQSVVWKKLRVPVFGYADGHVPSFATSLPELASKSGMMETYFFNFQNRAVEFFHRPDQLALRLDLSSPRSTLHQKELWLAGDETAKELARLLAMQPEDMRDNGWGFEHTRLETVARGGLLLLKNVTSAVGLDIEEVPEVKARFDDWRHMVQRWAVGDMSVEPSQERVRRFNEFNDRSPQFDCRPKLIKHIAESLAA